MSRVPPERMPMPDEGFPIKLVECHFPAPETNLFVLHWHPQMELIECLQGPWRVRVADAVFTVNEGDVIVIGGGEWHAGESLGHEVRFRTLIFHPEMLRSARLDACESDYVLPLVRGSVTFAPQIRHDATMAGLFDEVARELHTRGYGYEPEVKGLVLRLVSVLYRRYRLRELDESQIRLRVLNGERLQRAFDKMDAEAAASPKVADVAAHVGMSVSHFSRMFLAMTGLPPRRYWTLRRLERAEAFLLQGRGTVSEAAYASGFSDLNYFSRLFRRWRGRAPSEVLSRGSVLDGHGRPRQQPRPLREGVCEEDSCSIW